MDRCSSALTQDEIQYLLHNPCGNLRRPGMDCRLPALALVNDRITRFGRLFYAPIACAPRRPLRVA